MTTKQQNLSEASKEILSASFAAAHAKEDGTKTLAKSDAYIGKSVTKKDDGTPDYTKGVPSARPPGATPPVGQQKDGVGASKVTGPQDTMGRADLVHVDQADAAGSDDKMNRVAGKLAPQKMAKNPGANLQSYGENVQLDMTADVDALLEGESLSEEFKMKATTIFEAAVKSRVDVIAEQIESNLTEQFEEAVETVKEELSNKLDDYMNYVVEEWLKENQVAIDTGLRAELAEEFITGLRNLFVEHYISIPEDKVDVVEELANQVSGLEDALNEEIQRSISLTKALNEQKKIETIYTASEGLTQTQVEKLKGLAESIEFTTEDEFVAKIKTLKESYFKTEVKAPSSNMLDEEVHIEENKETNVSKKFSEMDVYAEAISKSTK